MKAIIYAAKSTEDAHGSIATQFADCRALAEREGLEIVAEYKDEGFSAYSGNRGPDLERAREHVARIQGVLVAQHSDRIARGAGDRPEAPEHLVEVVVALRRAGATLRTVQDDLFADPRIGLVMASLMGQRNTEDSARKSAAVRSGKRRAWERGEWPGGPPPDGFALLGKNDVRLDPDRIEVIRLIGELADQGWGDPSIARELNRRGHRTKGGGAWTRPRIQDLLTNPRYYGGNPWRRGTAEEEIKWDKPYPAPWNRADFERRKRGRTGRDLAKGSDRRPGRPHVNHALAGLAVCARCSEVMRPITSGYRRKDGSRRRTYRCRHVHEGTGLCDAPEVDAEAVDTGVINQLDRYLGDFEAWRDQLLDGYANERERLTHEVEAARSDLDEQTKIVKRTQSYIGVAEDEAQAKVAMRAAAEAEAERERRYNRLEAAEQALRDVPDEAPTDAMLDFYNELSAAVRGRVEGANTMARVNDALRDIFEFAIIECDGPAIGRRTTVTPMLPMDPPGECEGEGLDGWNVTAHGEPFIPDPDERIRPPLRPLPIPAPNLRTPTCPALLNGLGDPFDPRRSCQGPGATARED
jgi:site-specific DNA recombinase